MSSQTISNMTPAATLDGTEKVPVVQAGGNVVTTVANMVALRLPAGASPQVQYNNSGVLAGITDAALVTRLEALMATALATAIGTAGVIASNGIAFVAITIPTTDPHILGHIWNSSGTFIASQG